MVKGRQPDSDVKPPARRVVARQQYVRITALIAAAFGLQACYASYPITEGPKSINEWDEKRITESFHFGRTTLAEIETQLGTCPFSNFTEIEPKRDDGSPGRGAKFCVWTYKRGRGFKGGGLVYPTRPEQMTASKIVTMSFNPPNMTLSRIQIETYNAQRRLYVTVAFDENERWTSE